MINRPMLIAGLGSIGRRHLRNLISLGYKNVVLYRTGKGAKLEKDAARFPVECNLRSALSYNPAGVIISNPTSLHMPVALAAARAGCNLLIEKPVSHNLSGLGELEHMIKKQKACVLVGFQYRFHPALRKMKEWLDAGIIGKVTSFTAHWGEYLPGWHPNEDYSKGYSARRNLGGGVVNTLSHPFDYLSWFFGKANSVYAVIAKRSNLKVNVEDTAEILLSFCGGISGSIHLDYIERPSAHWIHVIGREGIMHWDNSDGIARVCNAKNEKQDTFMPPVNFERNSMFVDEMRHFLNCLSGKEKPLCTLSDGRQALRIAIAAKNSSVKKKEIFLDD